MFRAAFTAARPGVPSIKPFQRIVLGYDNTSLFWSLEREKFHPNFYIDITIFWIRNSRRSRCTNRRCATPIHHSSVQNVEFTARVRGREISRRSRGRLHGVPARAVERGEFAHRRAFVASVWERVLYNRSQFTRNWQ